MTLPDPDQALSMPIEELAGYLVMHHKQAAQGNFNVHNVICEIDSMGNSSSKPDLFGGDWSKKEKYKEALVEAYGWAFTEGFFIYDPNQMLNNWWRVSRRGQKLEQRVDALKFASREILPKAFLHPLIAEHAAPIFKMGKYDAAVFQAFKQVEIAVRDASNLPNDGAALMKAAFSKNDGILNTAIDPSEREGLMFVFAGAIQLFRNATGHQNLDLDPQEAAHLLIHASYLLTLLEKHSKAAKKSASLAVPVGVP